MEWNYSVVENAKYVLWRKQNKTESNIPENYSKEKIGLNEKFKQGNICKQKAAVIVCYETTAWQSLFTHRFSVAFPKIASNISFQGAAQRSQLLWDNMQKGHTLIMNFCSINFGFEGNDEETIWKKQFFEKSWKFNFTTLIIGLVGGKFFLRRTACFSCIES